MLFSFSPMFSYNCYKRALISSAATSALRLHQRLPVSTSTLSSSSLLYHYDCHFLTTTKFSCWTWTTTQNAKILQLGGHVFEVIKHRSIYNALFPAPISRSRIWATQLSWIKSNFDPFYAFVWNLTHFLQDLKFLKHRTCNFWAFLHVFYHSVSSSLYTFLITAIFLLVQQPLPLHPCP